VNTLTVDINLAITILTFVSLVITIMYFVRNSKKDASTDGGERASMKIEIEHIGKLVDEMNNCIKSGFAEVRTRQEELSQREETRYTAIMEQIATNRANINAHERRIDFLREEVVNTNRRVDGLATGRSRRGSNGNSDQAG